MTLERGLVELAALVKFDRRDADALAKDRSRVGRHAAGHRAADVHHMAEHRGKADQVALVKHRHQHHPVVEMADRAGAGVRIVLQDDVAGLEFEIALLEHIVDVRAELADDHAALHVANHREFVVLFADHRRHRRAEQHRIHLVAGIAQRVLDQVERNGIKPACLSRPRCRRRAGLMAAPAVRAGGTSRRRRLFGARLERSLAPNMSAQPRSASFGRPPQRRALVAVRPRRAELHLRGAVHRQLAEYGHRAAFGLVFDDFGRPSRPETAIEHRVEIGRPPRPPRTTDWRRPDPPPWAAGGWSRPGPVPSSDAEKMSRTASCWP